MSVTLSKAKLLCMENQRNKKLSSTLEALTQINKIPTLSERLKVAGIKECKSVTDDKRNNMKNSKKRNYYKKLYLEKATSKTFKSTSKTKGNLTKDYLLPYVNESGPNEDYRGEIPSKNYTGFPEQMDPNIQANTKETIFVSLDFLQDCQNYKRSIRKPKFTNSRFQKKKKTSKRRRSCINKKRESVKVKRVPYRPEKQGPSYGKVEKKYSPPKALEEKLMEAKSSDSSLSIVLEAIEEQRAPVNYDFSFPFETDIQLKFQEKVSQDSVGKIDKRFLESLLSIAMGMGKGDKTKEEKENKRALGEKQTHRKTKITGKAYYEGKVQNTEMESTSAKNEKIRSPAVIARRQTNVGNDSKTKVSFKELIPTKPARDTAKSEVQIPPLKGSSGEGSKMKSEKNMSLSKPDTDETRKKRKNRNKIMKISSEEFVEASFPSEVSKVADVKELWRRDAREKSDNSLSSYSSCTVPEGDEVPEWKSLGLQSYKILKKLVEEEVTKITPKSAKKDNTIEVENKENVPKTENSKETGKPKNTLNKLKVPLAECSENVRKGKEKKENEDLNVQREQTQVKKKQHYSVYEGKKPKSQLPSLPSEQTDKGSKEKLQLFDEMGKNMHKVPSVVVKEWSIINRLEQAFLVLGTPSFNDKGIHDSSLVENQNSNQVKKHNPGAENLTEGIKRKIRRPRSKGALGKKKNNNAGSIVKGATPRTPEDSSLSSTNSTLPRKKIKLDNKLNAVKEVQQKSKPEKEIKNDSAPSTPTTPNISNTEGDEENNLKQKEKRSPRTTPDDLVRRPAPSKSLEKLKTNVSEPRHAKKEMKGSKNKECITPPEQVKLQEVKPNKSSKRTTKAIKLHTNERKHKHEKRLERKKTFNVIQTKESTMIRPRKSKSCNKIEENYGQNGMKLCLSQTKTNRNPSGKTERGMEKETSKRNLKKMGKTYSMKEKHSNEKSKSGEKDFPRNNREGLVKSPKTRVVQEKKTEKPCLAEEFPQQILARKEANSNSNKRAIKERSILSMRLNQQDVLEQREQLGEIQETSDSVVPILVEANTSESQETDMQIDSKTLQQNFLRKYSNISCISSNISCNLVPSKPQNTCTETRVRLIIREYQDEGAAEDPEVALSASSLSNHVFGKRQSTLLGMEQTDLNPSKKQQLWEHDMNYYHSIVREIMSHYKRIDGFLKQSEQFDSLSSSLVNLSSKNSDADEESKALRNDLHSLQEYRKKVIYEYQALPFCEYKSQVQQKKEENTKSEDGRKRNLQVVKDVNTAADLDVKDFRLNIQKVLDSQLYVDADLLVKRNDSVLKFKEIPLYKSENSIKQY